MENTHSVRAIKKRAEFEGPQYKKYLKKIYYMGKPENNRNEYFALESLALDWIAKTIGVKLHSNLGLIKRAGYEYQRILANGVLCLDRITLFWNTTFLLENDGIWFIGPAIVSKSSVTIKAGKYTVEICQNEPGEFEISAEKCVRFSAPVPCLESTNIVDEFGTKTTYITKINWNNSKVQKANISANYATIHYATYKMHVYDLDKLIATIMPLK